MRQTSVCPRCGSPTTAGQRFCGRCGFTLSVNANCPRCGIYVSPDDIFCENCGMQLNQPMPQQQPPAPPYQQPQSSVQGGYQQQASYRQEAMKPQSRGRNPWLIVSIILILLVAGGGAVAAMNMGSGMPSLPSLSIGAVGGSPSSVVKAFYSAVNAGDFNKADEYLVPGTSMKSSGLTGLVGKIAKIEILDELREDVFGVEAATVTVEVTLTPAGESSWYLSMLGGTQRVILEKHDTGWKILSY